MVHRLFVFTAPLLTSVPDGLLIKNASVSKQIQVYNLSSETRGAEFEPAHRTFQFQKGNILSPVIDHLTVASVKCKNEGHCFAQTQCRWCFALAAMLATIWTTTTTERLVARTFWIRGLQVRGLWLCAWAELGPAECRTGRAQKQRHAFWLWELTPCMPEPSGEVPLHKLRLWAPQPLEQPGSKALGLEASTKHEFSETNTIVNVLKVKPSKL